MILILRLQHATLTSGDSVGHGFLEQLRDGLVHIRLDLAQPHGGVAVREHVSYGKNLEEVADQVRGSQPVEGKTAVSVERESKNPSHLGWLVWFGKDVFVCKSRL